MNNIIPSEYQPFDELLICSNTLIHTRAIIKIGETLPILVGKGLKFPEIWLKARVGQNKWISVIERSVSLSPQITINNDVESNTTTIKTNNIVIITAQQTDSKCIIKNLDLTPLGLNIIGNEQLLKVGQTEFSGNTMQGINTFIVINE